MRFVLDYQNFTLTTQPPLPQVDRANVGANRRFALISVLFLLLSACVTAPPQPTLAPGERPTPTAIVGAPTWTQATTPITLANAHQLRQIGSLQAPAPPSTVFDYAISPDGTRLVVLNNDFIIAWDLITGETVFSASRGGATRVFYSPDKDEVYTLYPDSTLGFLNAENGSVKTSIRAHEQFNNITAYFADEGWLALAGDDGSVKVWDTFERLSMVTIATGSPPDVMAFSPGGDQLAIATRDHVVTLWDWRGRSPLIIFDTLPSQVAHLAFSPDNRYLSAAIRDQIITWDLENNIVASVIRMGENAANTLLHFIPGTTIIAAGGSSGNITLWQVMDAGQIGVLDNSAHAAFALSPEGSLAFTASLENDVHLWRLEDTLARGTFSANNPHILDVAWTDDGFLVLFFDARGPVEVWGISE